MIPMPEKASESIRRYLLDRSAYKLPSLASLPSSQNYHLITGSWNSPRERGYEFLEIQRETEILDHAFSSLIYVNHPKFRVFPGEGERHWIVGSTRGLFQWIKEGRLVDCWNGLLDNSLVPVLTPLSEGMLRFGLDEIEEYVEAELLRSKTIKNISGTR